MFLPFIFVMIATISLLAGQLYMTLTLQAETVSTIKRVVAYEQVTQGILAYALAALIKDPLLQQRLSLRGKAEGVCNYWNTAQDGFIQGKIEYALDEQGLRIRVETWVKGVCQQGIQAVYTQDPVKKGAYQCMAIVPF